MIIENMTTILICAIIYFTITVIVAKFLFWYEKWSRKKAGVYNWDAVEPTIHIVLGFFWFLTIPIITISLLICGIISLIKFLFFKK